MKKNELIYPKDKTNTKHKKKRRSLAISSFFKILFKNKTNTTLKKKFNVLEK